MKRVRLRNGVRLLAPMLGRVGISVLTKLNGSRRMAVSELPRVTIRDRAIARQADEAGRRILRLCRGLLSAREIIVADPEHVLAGEPLVSLLLHRIGVEAHAYHASRIGADLSATLMAEAKRMRGENRTTVLRIAAVVERI